MEHQLFLALMQPEMSFALLMRMAVIPLQSFASFSKSKHTRQIWQLHIIRFKPFEFRRIRVS